jgi:hypothetical protein
MRACDKEGIVKLKQAWAAVDARRRAGLSLSRASWTHSAQGDLPPDGVTLGAELSIGGSGEEVSTQAEMVADGAEWPQETLRMLG